jgi:hypothetical protein
MHRRTFERCADVLAHERAGLGQRLRRAIDVYAAVRQLACALACEDEKRADATVDIDP